ncbi:hypothetical protein NDU88_000419 [Pleurodeles waltl]|uniref:Uncharacterized protein n=1 Tax=Pleurodeles waltl TaxID=8319 RepID=A0AAV7UPX6_PLEWA|nr:hypothetical protein NDU88_000419 [Pleurodeles waltl]
MKMRGSPLRIETRGTLLPFSWPARTGFFFYLRSAAGSLSVAPDLYELRAPSARHHSLGTPTRGSGNPHPKLLEEWSQLNAGTCKDMMGLLSKYAAIELEQVGEEIKKLKDILDKYSLQDNLQSFFKNMEHRLTKYEEEIKTKMRRKFVRDKTVYTAGKILTFGRKYVAMGRNH